MADLLTIEPEDPAADVIDTLERVLERAKAGEISSVSIAWVYRDGRCGWRRSSMPSFAALLGAVARMMHKLNLVMDEE